MVSVDPVDHRLMVNAEHAADAAEVSAFEVEAHRLAPSLLGVAERLRVRGVDALALFALVTLAAGAGVAGLSLLLG